MASTVEILRKEITTLAKRLQRQNKDIEALKREGSTIQCNTNGNDDVNNNIVFNNTILQGWYLNRVFHKHTQLTILVSGAK